MSVVRRMKLFSNNAFVQMDYLMPRGMWLVELFGCDGSLLDKVRCDDEDEAIGYFDYYCNRAKEL